MAETKQCGVILMRPGERSSHDIPDAGLKQNDSGNERGEKYIAEVIQAEGKEGPFGLVYCAPPLVCLETAGAFFKHNKALVTRSRKNKVEVAEKLYSRKPEWIAVVEALGGQNGIGGKKLADLKRVAPQDFLLDEGRRLYGFIENIAKEVPDDRMAFCVVPSPLAETIVVYLYEDEEERFKKPLEELPMLDYLDHYILIFEDDEYSHTIWRSYTKTIAEYRKKEAVLRRI